MVCCTSFPTLFPYTTLFRSVRVLALQTNEIDGSLAIGVLIERSEKFVFFQRTDDRVPLLLSVGIAGVFKIEERSEEHTSELQSHSDLVCRLLLEKKKK